MYTYCTTLPLRDALPLGARRGRPRQPVRPRPAPPVRGLSPAAASPLLQRDAEDHRGRAIIDRTRRAEAPVDIVVRLRTDHRPVVLVTVAQAAPARGFTAAVVIAEDRKSTRLNSSH